MNNKKIVLKVEGRKLEFENSLYGYQHLLDYVSREVKERTPRKVRDRRLASLVPKEKVRE